MAARSAGLLLHRLTAQGVVEVLIAHPGGPFWARKDSGAWSIPKGEYDPGEDALAAAYREFKEEVGLNAPTVPPLILGEVKQPGGKVVTVWAVASDLDVSNAASNTFELEWPKGSGRVQQFPEVDRVEWCSLSLARTRLLKGQLPFLERLVGALSAEPGSFSEGP